MRMAIPTAVATRWMRPTRSICTWRYKLSLGDTIEDMNLSLDVRNLTDEDPSFFNGNQGGFMGGAWGYDNYTANPVGRLITLGVRTKF